MGELASAMLYALVILFPSFLFCSSLVPKVQKTVVGEVRRLYDEDPLAQELDPLTREALCTSSQCRLCLSPCRSICTCTSCIRICGSKTSGFCSRCSYCAGGSHMCQRRCEAEQVGWKCTMCQ